MPEEQYHIFLKLYHLEQKLLDKKLPIAQARAMNYALTGLINACLNTNRFVKAEELLKVIERLMETNPEKEAELTNYYFWLQSWLFIQFKKGRHREGLQLLNEHLPRVIKSDAEGNYSVFLSNVYQLKIIFELSLRLYREGMLSVHELETLNKKTSSPLIYKDCEIVKALIQFDMRNEQLMQGILSSVLKKQKDYNLGKDERKIWNGFKKMNRVNYTEGLKHLHKQVAGMESPITIFKLLDLEHWIKSRAGGLEISRILHESLISIH